MMKLNIVMAYSTSLIYMVLINCSGAKIEPSGKPLAIGKMYDFVLFISE